MAYLDLLPQLGVSLTAQAKTELSAAAAAQALNQTDPGFSYFLLGAQKIIKDEKGIDKKISEVSGKSRA